MGKRFMIMSNLWKRSSII